MVSITFVCGTPIGGAVDSTVSLAEQARADGYDVRLLIASKSAYDRLPRVTAGLVRAERVRLLGLALWRVHDWCSSRTSRDRVLAADRASDVVAAAGRVHGPGGVIVINSVRRLDLRRLVDLGRRSGSHTVWYLREEAALSMAAELGPLVGTMVANSRPLAEQAAELAGRACAFVPSVISRDGLAEPRTRDTHLLVNPIASHGVDLVLSLARASPHRRFVLQESWTLDAEAGRRLSRAIGDLANVELRPRTERSLVFRDARALLLPHAAEGLGSARPRVALEAQLLGIPIVAHDHPGLAAVAGSADLLLPESGEVEQWVEALDRLDANYEWYSEEARHVAEREMPPPDAVWAAFRAALGAGLGNVDGVRG